MNHFRRTGLNRKAIWGTIEHPDGRIEPVVDMVPELAYDPVNRRTLPRWPGAVRDGRRLDAHGHRGSGLDTGFHLGTGLYFGFDGHHHGEWRGALHLDGERIDDCSTTPENRVVSTRSVTPWCESPIRRAAASATGTGSRSSRVRSPSSVSPMPRRRSCDSQGLAWGICRSRTLASPAAPTQTEFRRQPTFSTNSTTTNQPTNEPMRCCETSWTHLSRHAGR